MEGLIVLMGVVVAVLVFGGLVFWGIKEIISEAAENLAEGVAEGLVAGVTDRIGQDDTSENDDPSDDIPPVIRKHPSDVLQEKADRAKQDRLPQ
jgi:hypothetical protein